MNKYRTHTCGELGEEHIGQEVRLAGWLFNIRDKGSIMFITLRDQFGVTQAVISDEAMMNTLREIPRESTVSMLGTVVKRTDVNPAMKTGMIEIIPKDIEILGKCSELLPFEIATSLEAREDNRLKYRFLDLRNEKVHNNIVLRSKVIQSIRRRMNDEGFLEIQTPILTSSSPEGARDYIVPSRVHEGKFYALPQAPQQFKQLLMVSGFDKYFQIAPCFRDEDARADRSPGEFYQLDMEMSFAEQEDVFRVIEKVLHGLFTEFSSWEVECPFPRISYAEAMEKYGSDKPDLRNPLIIKDVSQVFANTEFNAFQGKTIRAIAVPNCADRPRKFFDGLNDRLMQEGGRLAWLKVADDLSLSGSIAKFVTDSERLELLKSLDAEAGFGIFLVADDKKISAKLSGLLRTEIAKAMDLIEQNVYKFCWIVDFPMYELNEETNKVEFSHNPFSMPQGGLEALLTKNPLDILAYQYDIVCNGIELSSGAVRNHDVDVMIKAFDIAGYSEEVVSSKFPALFNAFKFGAPPHAGIAPGVDRIVMLLANEPNIREVIAFPMNKSAQDLLMGAPSEITEEQLKEANILVRPKAKE